MYSKIKLIILGFIIFIFFPSNVLSAEVITITSFPTSKNAGEEFSINFSAQGLINSASYYMKGLGGNTTTTTFTEVDTWNNGWVQQNGSWISMPTFSANSEGSASATLKVRFDPNVSTNTKDFKLRIRKTDADTNIDSGIVAIAVTAVTPAPTQTATATSVATSTPTQTVKPTLMPTVKATVKPSPTQKPTVVPSPIDLVDEEFVVTNEPILSKSPVSEVLGSSVTKKKLPFISYVFVLLGLSFLGYVGYMLYNGNYPYNNKHQNNDKDTENT